MNKINIGTLVSILSLIIFATGCDSGTRRGMAHLLLDGGVDHSPTDAGARQMADMLVNNDTGVTCAEFIQNTIDSETWCIDQIDASGKNLPGSIPNLQNSNYSACSSKKLGDTIGPILIQRGYKQNSKDKLQALLQCLLQDQPNILVYQGSTDYHTVGTESDCQKGMMENFFPNQETPAQANSCNEVAFSWDAISYTTPKALYGLQLYFNFENKTPGGPCQTSFNACIMDGPMAAHLDPGDLPPDGGVSGPDDGGMGGVIGGVLTSDLYKQRMAFGNQTDAGGGGAQMAWTIEQGGAFSIAPMFPDQAISIAQVYSIATIQSADRLKRGSQNCSVEVMLANSPQLSNVSGLIFRYQDRENYWQFAARSGRYVLMSWVANGVGQIFDLQNKNTQYADPVNTAQSGDLLHVDLKDDTLTLSVQHQDGTVLTQQINDMKKDLDTNTAYGIYSDNKYVRLTRFKVLNCDQPIM